MGATASRKAPAAMARERVLPMTFMAHLSLHVWIFCEHARITSSADTPFP